MWFRTVIFLIVALAIESDSGFAQQAESPVKNLVTRAIKLPASYFTRPDTTNPEGTRQQEQGIKVLPLAQNEHAGHRRLDVRDFLKSMGVPLTEESEAIYFEGADVLVVRVSEESLEMLSLLGLDNSACWVPHGIQTTFTLVQFALDKPLEETDVLSYANLRKLAGNSWQVIDRQILTTKSGMLAKHSAGVNSGQSPFVENKDEEASEPTSGTWKPRSFSGDEFGTRIGVEPVIGPDSLSIDLSIDYRHRSKAGENRTPFEINLNTMTAVWDGYPVVLQLVQSSESKGIDGAQKYRALILKAQLVNSGGWPQREPKLSGTSTPE